MNQKKSSIVFISLGLRMPDPTDYGDPEFNRRVDLVKRVAKKIAACDKENVVPVAEFDYLLDQDECYPELLTLMSCCAANDITLFVAELGESPVLLSPLHQDAVTFLKEKGHAYRMFGHPKPKASGPSTP